MRRCKRCQQDKSLDNFDSGRWTCYACRYQREQERCSDIEYYMARVVARTRSKLPYDVPINLTVDYLMQVLHAQGDVCAITKREMTTDPNNWSKISIDRIDPAGGYVEGNVRLVCWAVNMMRNRMSDDELRDWTAAICNGLVD